MKGIGSCNEGCRGGPRTRRLALAMWLSLLVCVLLVAPAEAEPGVTPSTIRIGGVMDLEGVSRGLGLGMKTGIEAAVRGQRVRGRRIEFVTLNDSYTPEKSKKATEQLLSQGVFAVVGNVGTPTAKVTLPILAEQGVPAVGFFTGAGILRPGVGDIINFRASYVQETAAVIRQAINAGIKPTEICAYVQNDAYGMAGVEGIKRALAGRRGVEQIVSTLDDIMGRKGALPKRNNLGPVGVYVRNTFTSRDGYNSLKAWESRTGNHCRLVVSVGTYNAIARFAAYARLKGDDWIVSAVSFTGADNYRVTLREFGVTDKVVMTQVVPPLDSDLPIVQEARAALGDDYGYVSLEGYIVGKMFLAIMSRVQGEVTRKNFLRAVRGQRFNVGGVKLDFTEDNQGSDLVAVTYLAGAEYRTMTRTDWRGMVQR